MAGVESKIGKLLGSDNRKPDVNLPSARHFQTGNGEATKPLGRIWSDALLSSLYQKIHSHWSVQEICAYSCFHS